MLVEACCVGAMHGLGAVEADERAANMRVVADTGAEERRQSRGSEGWTQPTRRPTAKAWITLRFSRSIFCRPDSRTWNSTSASSTWRAEARTAPPWNRL
ncbi:MAG: hypothetical protein M5U09_07860 [Gammaproteobacteria bacterium]|nr:hypothetical protein [Gammaproteobacteria bacterium]